MKDPNINLLLEKYWKAETTLQEEEILSSYFRFGHVAKEHEAFKPLFSYFIQEKSEKYSKTIAFGAESNIKPMINWKKRILSIAAAVLVLISATWLFNTNLEPMDSNTEYVSVEDPDQALDVTMDALAFLGSKINKNSDRIHQNIAHTDKMNIIKSNQ